MDGRYGQARSLPHGAGCEQIMHSESVCSKVTPDFAHVGHTQPLCFFLTFSRGGSDGSSSLLEMSMASLESFWVTSFDDGCLRALPLPVLLPCAGLRLASLPRGPGSSSLESVFALGA